MGTEPTRMDERQQEIIEMLTREVDRLDHQVKALEWRKERLREICVRQQDRIKKLERQENGYA